MVFVQKTGTYKQVQGQVGHILRGVDEGWMNSAQDGQETTHGRKGGLC